MTLLRGRSCMERKRILLKRHLTATPEHAGNLLFYCPQSFLVCPFSPELLTNSLALLSSPLYLLSAWKRGWFTPDSERCGHSGLWWPSCRQVTMTIWVQLGMNLWKWQLKMCVTQIESQTCSFIKMIMAQSDCHSFEKPFIWSRFRFLYEQASYRSKIVLIFFNPIHTVFKSKWEG